MSVKNSNVNEKLKREMNEPFELQGNEKREGRVNKSRDYNGKNDHVIKTVKKNSKQKKKKIGMEGLVLELQERVEELKFCIKIRIEGKILID